MKNVTFIILFLSLHFLSLPLFAHKHFNLIVRLPKAVNLEKLEVWLDNGKENNKLTPQSLTEKQMVLSGDYFSAYAVISLQYTPNAPEKGFARDFFINEKPATITFASASSTGSPFANYSLQNVLTFEKEKKQMDDYSASELKKSIDYEKLYGEKIFSGNDTAVRNYYFKVLGPAVGRKKLEYILSHTNSYFSFYIFRTEVAKPYIVSWDSLQRVFQTFPDTFKYSDEGNYLNAFLHSRQLSIGSSNAVDFSAKDIHKNKVSLSEFKGSKYVLLHFWATWCTPCIRELPALKQINDQYAAKGLQIISIAIKSNDADYGKAIKKYQLNWIHIYDDIDLMNKYGNQPTPRICLVDKTGKLVYDNIGLGDNNDFQLDGLKTRLKEVVK